MPLFIESVGRFHAQVVKTPNTSMRWQVNSSMEFVRDHALQWSEN